MPPAPASCNIDVMTTTRESDDAERDLWLKVSEEALLRIWDNPGDDVFSELLSD